MSNLSHAHTYLQTQDDYKPDALSNCPSRTGHVSLLKSSSVCTSLLSVWGQHEGPCRMPHMSWVCSLSWEAWLLLQACSSSPRGQYFISQGCALQTQSKEMTLPIADRDWHSCFQQKSRLRATVNASPVRLLLGPHVLDQTFYQRTFWNAPPWSRSSLFPFALSSTETPLGVFRGNVITSAWWVWSNIYL